MPEYKRFHIAGELLAIGFVVFAIHFLVVKRTEYLTGPLRVEQPPAMEYTVSDFRAL